MMLMHHRTLGMGLGILSLYMPYYSRNLNVWYILVGSLEGFQYSLVDKSTTECYQCFDILQTVHMEMVCMGFVPVLQARLKIKYFVSS